MHAASLLYLTTPTPMLRVMPPDGGLAKGRRFGLAAYGWYDEPHSNELLERAFTLFTRLTSFLNVGIDRAPGIIMRLEGWVQNIQNLARRLAESLGADSYSIGISMPVGVSFDLSFNT